MPKKTAARKKTFGADLIEGMKLVVAHQRGKIELEQTWPRPADARQFASDRLRRLNGEAPE